MVDKADRLKAQALQDVCMTMSTVGKCHEDGRRKVGIIDGKDTNKYKEYEGNKGDGEENTVQQSASGVLLSISNVSVITGSTMQLVGGNVDFEN